MPHDPEHQTQGPAHFLEKGRNQAQNPADMDLPGFRLHLLKGDYKGFYAVDVSGNWRIVFRFEGSDTADIDLTDYH